MLIRPRREATAGCFSFLGSDAPMQAGGSGEVLQQHVRVGVYHSIDLLRLIV
jgi:hypothetical protein